MSKYDGGPPPAVTQIGFGGRGMRNINLHSKPQNTKAAFRRLWKYLSRHKTKLFVVVLFVIANTLSTLFATRLVGIGIDDYILKGDFVGLSKIIVLLIGIYIVVSVTVWFQSILSVKISTAVVIDIREELFDKLQALPLKFFDTHTHGDLMSRVSNDVDNISNALNTSFAQVISSFLTVTGTLIFMLLLSPVLTLVSFTVIPLLLLTTKTITKHSRKYFKQQQAVLGQLNGKIEEVISGQKVVKIFIKEEDEIQEFEQLNNELKKIGVHAQAFSGMIPPLSMGFNNLSYGLISIAGAMLAVLGKIQVGSITSFLIYARQFTRPLNDLANQYNSLLSALSGAERVFEILDEEPEPPDSADAVELTDVSGDVSLQHVYFGYLKHVDILKDVTLEAKAGQTIALVGPTGAGKTTIINLLSRFYDIQSGAITIDGINITNIKRKSLRAHLAIVLQDTYLFSGTIKENIRYGRINATDEEITQASKLANAHEFICRLYDGYDTVVSENADSLSHGQRQMISIARAILANPSILILDEATSNVDTRTEIKIQEAMLNLMKGRTNFVIAHRLSTIRNADLIAVIDDGRIIETGTHSQLIGQKGFYYGLYNNQYSND